jgi:hypothetical protein
VANAGKLLAVLLTLLGAGGVWVYTSRPYLYWVGGYELSVRILCGAECPTAVTCEAHHARDVADYVCDNLIPPETLMNGASARPFSGEPLAVRIKTTGKDSMSGRPLSWFQQSFLVVIAEMPDGSLVGKVVDIPDGRVSKEVTVAFP